MTFATAITLALIALLLNIVTYCVYWWDKDAAREGGWRVGENTLLGLALFGGSPAALLARRWLRHKTRKQPFVSLLNGIVALQITTLVALSVIVTVPGLYRPFVALFAAIG